MEPLLGGQLVDPPQQIQDLWDTATVKRKPADWALQWLWNQPEVSVVLSGMSTMEQVEENYEKPDRARGVYGWLSGDQKAGADACIQCGECEYKCPQTIPISEWMPVVHQVLGEGKSYDACSGP